MLVTFGKDQVYKVGIALTYTSTSFEPLNNFMILCSRVPSELRPGWYVAILFSTILYCTMIQVPWVMFSDTPKWLTRKNY